MSNDAQKADQIAFHFFTKLFYVVNDARATTTTTTTPEPRVSQQKADKWFNLETCDSELFAKEARDKYRSVSAYPPPPPLEIQVLLCVPELNANQVLVHTGPAGNGSSASQQQQQQQLITPVPSHIVLERWTLAFVPHDPYADDDDDGGSVRADVAPPTIYKNGIPLFRSVYSLLRLLPAWALCKRTQRRAMGVRTRVCDEGSWGGRVLDFGSPPPPGAGAFPAQTHVFPPVQHPSGALRLACRYLAAPRFDLVDREAYYSSNLLNEPDFVPTLAKNQQTAAGSVADRFIVPRTSPRPSPSSKNVPLPLTRAPPTMGGGGSPSGSLPRQEGSWQGGAAAAAASSSSSSISSRRARIRTESGSGASLPAAAAAAGIPGSGGGTGTSPVLASPLPVRRPGLNPVHPFKANTLAAGTASSSLGRGSPLSGPSTLSSAMPTNASSLRNSVGSGGGGGGGGGSAASSQAKFPVMRQSPGSEDKDKDKDRAVGVPPRKRYSSSFGHRYSGSGNAGAGAGSDGSVGSGGTPGEREKKEGCASFLSTHTDDDEISSFVHDIDARAPLRRERRTVSSGAAIPSPLSSSPPTGPGIVRPAAAAGTGAGAGASPPGRDAMLTTQDEVEERLRRMNEMFEASLRGLSRSSPGAGGQQSSSGNRASLQGSEEFVGRLDLGGSGKESPGPGTGGSS